MYVLNSQNKRDGRELLAEIPQESVAAAFFDPQYRGLLDRMDYGNEADLFPSRMRLPQMDDGMIWEFTLGIFKALKPSGYLFMWLDKFHLCEGIDGWIPADMQKVDLITWYKTGRFGPGYRTRRVCEYLMVFQKKPIRAKGTWSDHRIPDVWEESMTRKAHPHAKPIGLQRSLIQSVTKEGEVVLDPAAGSYGVMIAAKQTERVFIGADITTTQELLTWEKCN